MRLSIEEMESNLHRGWELITPQHLYNGLHWYPEAHVFAREVGHGNVQMGAGLIAALSPNKAWDTNKKLALDAGNGIFGGHVGNALLKAQVIYAGGDPASVLPMAKKTGHFYMNILNPTDPNWVTVDRHMIRVLKWMWDEGEPKVTVREYDDCVLAVQKFAANVGVVPSVGQASLWEWAREFYKA